MEINNIYEDYSGERLYSVLLDESELALFSERSRAGWKEAWRGAKAGAIGGLGLTSLPILGGMVRGDKLKPGRTLGVLGAGSLLGSIVGAGMGYNYGTNKWDSDEKFIKEEKQNSYKLDKDLIKDFSYKNWVSFSKNNPVPEDVLTYVKFYETIWSKKLDAWYKDFEITRENLQDDEPVIPSFTCLFTTPINSNVVEQIYSKLNILPVCLIDSYIYIYYDPDKQKYSIYPESPYYKEFTSDSLGKTLIKYLDEWWIKPYSKLLTKPQLRLVEEYKQSLKKYSIY